MKRFFWKLFPVIILHQSLIATSLMCNRDDNCRCYPGLELEIQCPHTSDGERFVIHLRDQTAKIDCYEMDDLRMDLLPNITLDGLSRLEMNSCPPPMENFKEIVDHFSMRAIKVVQFEDWTRDISLSREYFAGLDLDRLKLHLLNFTQIDDDVFSSLPNLYSLEMERNRNLTLTEKIFQNLTNLRSLHLAQNRLEEVPVFGNLYNLRSLHLWNNHLTVIQEDDFSNLSNLTSLDLNANRIGNISDRAFRNLRSLRSVNLSGNKLVEVSGEIFRDKENISVILLGHNPGLRIGDYFFAGFASLEEIDLSNCDLSSLPEHTFQDSTNLAIINLRKNRLGEIPSVLFRGLFNLKILFLQENSLSVIDEDMFRDLSGLERINLAMNSISVIQERVFYGKRSLKFIDLSHNNYSGDGYLNILEDSPEVVDLKFSHNLLRTVRDVVSSHSMLRLGKLDLSHNRITEIWLTDLKSSTDMVANLDDNDIATIHLDNIEDISGPGRTTIFLKGNALTCSCHTFELVQFLRGEKYQKKQEMFEITTEDLICESPSRLYGERLEDLPASVLSCDSGGYCPGNCSCSWRPSDRSIVIDCRNLNLTEFPVIEDPGMKNHTLFDFNQTELHLEGNFLENLPDLNSKGYNNVTRLFLSSNRIKGIEWLPSNLETLYLDNNHLSVLNYGILDILNKSHLVNLTLRNNPWICDCNSVNLTNFLRQNSKQVDVSSISCFNSDKILNNLTEADLCNKDLILYILVPILGVILFFMILLAVFFRYREEIKIWLFAHDLLLCWVTEEELDKDKTYDAFISYSHKDEDFVLEKLVPELEHGPDPYKLCLHFRNWIPGEVISQQVVDTVAASRRTVIVLSSNYLESFWGKMEFQTAHMHAMTEGRTRVIIIVYGPLDVKKLDGELKAYINTNTYLKWGDPLFWERLKFALPHPKSKVSKKRQKLANVMDCYGC